MNFDMTTLQLILSATGGFVLLLLLLLFCGRTKLRITYRDRFVCTLSFFGVTRNLVAKKEDPPQPELCDLTDCENPEARIKKAWARQRRKLERANAQKAKKAAKEARNAKKKAEKAKSAPKLGVAEILPMLLEIIKGITKATKGRFRMKIDRLILSVASDDAASTAVLYGSVSGALAALLDFLDQNKIRVKIAKNGVRIDPDFLSDKPTVDLSVTLSTSFLHGIHILLRSGAVIVSARTRANRRAKARIAKKGTPAEASADNIKEETQKG